MILGIYNHKGGVGKTATAVNLAYEFSKKGNKVCAVDCDGQCNLSEFFDADCSNGIYEAVKAGFSEDMIRPTRYENIDVVSCSPAFEDLIDEFLNGECGSQDDVISRITEMKEHLEKKYDIVLLDFPPQFTTFIKLLMMILCDKILLITHLEVNSLKGIESVNDFMFRHEIECIGVVVNKYNETAFENNVISALKGGMRIMNTKIHAQNSIPTAYRNGKCLREMYGDNDKYPKRADYERLAEELVGIM